MEEKFLKTKGPGRYMLIVGGALLVAGVLVALNVLGVRGHNDQATHFAGMLVAGFSLIPLGVGLMSVLRSKGTLRLSETGFHDPQLFRHEIPWSGLQAVELADAQQAGMDTVFLRITPEAFKAAGVFRLARVMLMANPGRGIGYTDKMIEGTTVDFANEIHAYATEALQRTP